jgi:hypothetical protein
MGDRVRDALGITGTLFVMFFFGMALDDGMGQFMTGTGFVALALTFGGLFLAVLLWLVWFYRRR